MWTLLAKKSFCGNFFPKLNETLIRLEICCVIRMAHGSDQNWNNDNPTTLSDHLCVDGMLNIHFDNCENDPHRHILTSAFLIFHGALTS